LTKNAEIDAANEDLKYRAFQINSFLLYV